MLAAEATLMEVKKEIARSRHQQTRQIQMDALKQYGDLIPSQWPASLRSEVAYLFAGVASGSVPAEDDGDTDDGHVLNVFHPKGPFGGDNPWYQKLEKAVADLDLDAKLSKFLAKLQGHALSPGSLRPANPPPRRWSKRWRTACLRTRLSGSRRTRALG